MRRGTPARVTLAPGPHRGRGLPPDLHESRSRRPALQRGHPSRLPGKETRARHRSAPSIVPIRADAHLVPTQVQDEERGASVLRYVGGHHRHARRRTLEVTQPPRRPREGRVDGGHGIVLDDPHRSRLESDRVIPVVSLCRARRVREFFARLLPFRAPRRRNNLERPVGQERQEGLPGFILPFHGGKPRELRDRRGEHRGRGAHGRREGRAGQRGDERAAAVDHRRCRRSRHARVPPEQVLLHSPVGGEHPEDVGVVFVPSHQRRPRRGPIADLHARIPHLSFEVPVHVSPRPHLDAVSRVAGHRHAERRAIRRPRQRAHSIARAVARKIEPTPSQPVTLEEHDASTRRRRGDERSPRLPRERRRGRRVEPSRDVLPAAAGLERRRRAHLSVRVRLEVLPAPYPQPGRLVAVFQGQRRGVGAVAAPAQRSRRRGSTKRRLGEYEEVLVHADQLAVARCEEEDLPVGVPSHGSDPRGNRADALGDALGADGAGWNLDARLANLRPAARGRRRVVVVRVGRDQDELSRRDGYAHASELGDVLDADRDGPGRERGLLVRERAVATAADEQGHPEERTRRVPAARVPADVYAVEVACARHGVHDARLGVVAAAHDGLERAGFPRVGIRRHLQAPAPSAERY